jgi:hypothetical protein
VDYAADVRLLRPDRHGPAIEGRSLNLSSSGIFVRAEERCAIGTAVTCAVPLPGGIRQLSGLVVRVQPLPGQAVGLGIRFLEIPLAARAQLAEMVRQVGDRSRLVEVRFEGLPQPVRARAVPTEDGLRLSTPLSFLRLASQVDVTVSGEALAMSSRGTLRAVELAPRHPDGIPRLVVDVGLGEPAGALPSAAPAPGGDVVLESPPAPAPSGRLSIGRARAASRAPVRRGRANEGRRASDPSGAVAAPVRGPRLTRSVAILSSRPRPPAASLLHGRPARQALLLMAGAVVAGAAVSGALTAAHLGRLAPARRPGAAVAAAPLAPAGAGEGAALAPGARLASPALPWPGASPPAPAIPAGPAPTRLALRALPPGTPGPEISRDGVTATATVPVEGSIEGMFHYTLAHPRGVAVNLPFARATLPLGLHLVQHDGFRTVWIRERREGGVQIRFGFTSPPPDEQLLELEPDAVKVRVLLAQP